VKRRSSSRASRRREDPPGAKRGLDRLRGTVEIVEAELTSLHVELAYSLAGRHRSSGGGVAGLRFASATGEGDELPPCPTRQERGGRRASPAPGSHPDQGRLEFEPPSREATGRAGGSISRDVPDLRQGDRRRAGVAGVTINPVRAGGPGRHRSRRGLVRARARGLVAVAARREGLTFVPGERTSAPRAECRFRDRFVRAVREDPRQRRKGSRHHHHVQRRIGSGRLGAGGLWRKNGLSNGDRHSRTDDWSWILPDRGERLRDDLDFVCVAYKLSGRVTHAGEESRGFHLVREGYKAVTTDAEAGGRRAGLPGPSASSRRGRLVFDRPDRLDGPTSPTSREARAVINEFLVRNDTLGETAYRDEEGCEAGLV